MSDVVLNSELLRTAASDLSGTANTVPTTSPLAMGAVSASDVTVAANNFNLWLTYTGLVAKAQLTALSESTKEAAVAMEQMEEQLAANAVSP